MIGIPQLTTLKSVTVPTVEPLETSDPIPVTPAPRFQPPPITDSATTPAPMVAPSFEGQFLGKGGTPFGSMPSIYLRPYILPPIEVMYPYEERGGDPDGAVPQIQVKAPRPGEDSVMPVPTGQQPKKSELPPQQPSISPLPPVTGKLGSVDLAKVPFWVWLVAAAVLGAKLLK